MNVTLLSRLRRARWLHVIQILVFVSWMMNPFPGAFSYWTLSDGVKSEMANPAEYDPWYQQDGDGDGFNNAQEAQFGSDPYRLDSDLDGLPDLVEYQYSLDAITAGTPLPYDPWSWDTNGNGFSDFDEFYQQIQAYNPVVNYASLTAGTFCSYSDADGDGLKNFEDSEPFNTDRDGDLLLNWNEAAGQMDDQYNGAGPPNSDPPPPTDPGVIIGGTWYPTGTMDSDGDGTPDHLDSFPYGSFWYQGIEYGGASSDRDIDGIPDPADPFPDGSYWYGATEYAAPWVDQDGDGIPDGLDPWPTIAGSYTYNGTQYPGVMPDQDGDGTPDGFDPTPNGEAPPPAQDPWNGQPHYTYIGVEYAGTWSDQDLDGIPDAQDATPNGGYWYGSTEYPGAWIDQDADGIPDAADTWPNDWWNGAPHFNYNGVEYPGSSADDRDSDTIPDSADAYPDDRTNRADSDLDGLSDYDETTQHGTDPAKGDTDDDRLNDSDELYLYHTNPLLAKTNPDQPFSDFYMVNQADGDSDGIPNGIEQWYADQGLGMNPADPADARGDLDGDGYTNLQAYSNGWSLNAHSGTYDVDQDGILDVLEDAWSAAYPGILSNSNFNDAAEDFDGDGLMNYEEIALGLNPGSAHSRSPAVMDMQEWVWRVCAGMSVPNQPLSGITWNTAIQPAWQVTTDGDNDRLPDGLLALATALNADPSIIIVPPRAASGDYDGDGMLDFWEHLYHLDPRDPGDAQANPDGDSLINSLEYAQSRNPLVSDDPPPLLPPDDPTATPHIVTTSLPDGSVNAGYNGGIVVSGGTSPYQFSFSSGSLPDGLFLDANGGITGTPTTEMGSTFTVQVVDGAGLSASQAFTLNVMPDAAGGGGTGGTGGDGGTGTTGGDGTGGGNGDGTGTGGNGDGNNGNDSPQPATGGAEIVARSANAQLLEVRSAYNTAAPKLKQMPFDTSGSSSTQDGATSEFIAAQTGDDIVSITVSEAPQQPTVLPWEYFVQAYDPDTGSSMGMERRTFTGTLAGAQAAKNAADPDGSGSGPDPVGGFIPWKWRVAGIRNVLDTSEAPQGGLLEGYQYGQKLWGATDYQILQTKAQIDALEADAPLSWVDAATSPPSNSLSDEAWLALSTGAQAGAGGGWLKYKDHYIPQGGATEVRLRRTDLSAAALLEPITRKFLLVHRFGSEVTVAAVTLTIAAGQKVSHSGTGPGALNGSVVLVGKPDADNKTDSVTEELVAVDFVTKGEDGSFVPQLATWNSVASPVIELTQVTATPANGAIQLSLEGKIKDDTSDCTPTPGKQISKLNIDAGGQTYQVSIDNTAQPDPNNLWRPYPFDGHFTTTVNIPMSPEVANYPVSLTTEINAGGMSGQVELMLTQSMVTQSSLSSLTFSNGYVPSERNLLSLQTTANGGTTQTVVLRQAAVGSASFKSEDANIPLLVTLPGFSGTTGGADTLDVQFIENANDVFPINTRLHLVETGAATYVFALDTQSGSTSQLTVSQTSQNGPGTFFPTMFRISGGPGLFAANSPPTANAMDHEWQLKYISSAGYWFAADDNGKPVVFNHSLYAHTDIQTKKGVNKFKVNLHDLNGDYEYTLDMVQGLVVKGRDVSILLSSNGINGWEKKTVHKDVHVYTPKNGTSLTHSADAYSPDSTMPQDVKPEILWRFIATPNTVVAFGSADELINDLLYRQAVVDTCTRNPEWSFPSATNDKAELGDPAFWIDSGNIVKGLISKSSAETAFEAACNYKKSTNQAWDYSFGCARAVDFIVVGAARTAMSSETWQKILPIKPSPTFMDGFLASRDAPGKKSSDTDPNTPEEEEFLTNWIPGDCGVFRNYTVPMAGYSRYVAENVIYLGGCYDFDKSVMKQQGCFYGHTPNIAKRIQRMQAWLTEVEKYAEKAGVLGDYVVKINGRRHCLKQPPELIESK